MSGTATRPGRSALLRRHGRARAANTELFFDLVYVFAVTQLSHRLVEHLTVHSALQTALLLALVWVAWIYTTWVTNWLDPERVPTRVMLLALMLASLVMSAGLPQAFTDRGWWVAGAFTAMHVGRGLYAVWALQGDPLRRNFQRIVCWSVGSSALVLLGAATDGTARELLWLAAVTVDVLGGTTGFRVPGLGRSTTQDWTIDGGHIAERCQAFVLIALGESVVVTGETLAGVERVTGAVLLAFGAAFAGAVGLWWVYFDRAAGASAERAVGSADPGRLGRSAFHMLHPLMIAGIILTAAADERVLDGPLHTVGADTAALMLGGTALFLFGHALFVATVWRTVAWSRLLATAVLLALFALHGHVSTLVLGAATLVVVLAVIASDAVTTRRGSHFADGDADTEAEDAGDRHAPVRRVRSG